MQLNRSRLIWIGMLLILFISGMIGGYIYFLGRDKVPINKEPFGKEEVPQEADLSNVRIYYPLRDSLLMEERRVKRQPSTPLMASAIIEEFLKGPLMKTGSVIPGGTRLLNVFIGKDGILYIDLSDDVRRNFQGDGLAELLFLKGIYESIISNLSGIEDVKILVEGKEIESFGGHMSILYPLKNTVSVTLNKGMKDEEEVVKRKGDSGSSNGQ